MVYIARQVRLVYSDTAEFYIPPTVKDRVSLEKWGTRVPLPELPLIITMTWVSSITTVAEGVASSAANATGINPANRIKADNDFRQVVIFTSESYELWGN